MAFWEPLAKIRSAEDARYENIKEIIGPPFTHPREVLPTYKTVLSFFLPFTKKKVDNPILQRGKTQVFFLYMGKKPIILEMQQSNQ